MQNLSEMGNAALTIAMSGVRIIPFSPQKKPYAGFTNWAERATTDKEQIRQWWTIWSNSLICAPTGVINSFWVLDIDSGNGKNGLESLAKLEAQFGKLESSMVVRTPSGGLHFYFRLLEGQNIPSNASVIAPHIDLRGEGGLIILPPSIRPDGKYEIIEGGI
jgi:putative DNA primase/helicase